MIFYLNFSLIANMESKNKHIGESEARSIWIEQARCHECARCHQVEAGHPFGKGLGEGSGVPVVENVKRYNVKMCPFTFLALVSNGGLCPSRTKPLMYVSSLNQRRGGLCPKKRGRKQNR